VEQQLQQLEQPPQLEPVPSWNQVPGKNDEQDEHRREKEGDAFGNMSLPALSKLKVVMQQHALIARVDAELRDDDDDDDATTPVVPPTRANATSAPKVSSASTTAKPVDGTVARENTVQKPPAKAEMSIEERIAAALAGGDTSAGESSGMDTRSLTAGSAGSATDEWDDDDLADLMN
jgi:hypothetical protein